METAEIDAALDELEVRLERLRALYEQYFLGLEKIEPLIARKDVERRIYVLRREKIRNTGRRFKFQTLIQRFNTFQQYWQRIVREIENGTYRRHVQRAERTVGPTELLTVAARRRFGKERAKKQADAEQPSPAAPPQEQASGTPALELTDAPAPVEPSKAPPPEQPALPAAFQRAAKPAAATPLESLDLDMDFMGDWDPAATQPGRRPVAEPSPARLPPVAPVPPPLRTRPHNPAPVPAAPAPRAAPSAPRAAPPAPPSRAALSPVQAAPAPPPGAPVRPPGAPGRSPARQPAGPAQAPAPGPAARAPVAPAPAQATAARPVAAPAQATARAPAPAAPAPQPNGGSAQTGEATRPRRRQRSTHPGLGPPPAGTPGAPPAAARRPAAASTLSEEHLRTLHAKLTEESRRNNAPGVTLEGMTRSLRAAEERLRAQQGANRRIEFEVIVRDGKPAIKPTVR